MTATSLLAALSRAQAEGKLADQLAFYAKPKLLIVDEFGYLPLEKQTANLFFQLVSRRYERGSMLITTNQTSRSGATSSATRPSPPRCSTASSTTATSW